jgi:KaiC/GvpD/RAD55 family RecA-like ATPase
MQTTKTDELLLPYSEVFYKLLQSIHQSLWYCYSFDQTETEKKRINPKYQKKFLEETDKTLESHFKIFEKWYRAGINKHISKGLAPDPQKKFSIYPRISKITIQAYKDAKTLSEKANSKATVLPSPLNILYQFLTIPSEPQSSAYPLVLCRSMLFIFFGLHPTHPDIENIENPEFKNHYPNLDPFTEKEVLESVSSFSNYIKIQLRWPDKRKDDVNSKRKETKAARINYLVGHFLAMKGYAQLWFLEETDKLTKNSVNRFCHFPDEISFEEVVRKYRKPEYRFRLSESLIDLPESGEIINSLFGIPIPVRGAETIFYGGLKKTSTGGLVINLAGKPGAGKTSIALSLATLLSPFNTKCIYISLEEEKNDLFTRLVSLVPTFLKELSIYKDPKTLYDNDWFNVTKLSGHVNISILTDILKFLSEELDKRKKNTHLGKNSIPSICPLYVVIDNINELLAGYKDGTDDYNAMEEFIYQCRKLGALVLLISAEEQLAEIRLDYLVDVSIHVRQSGVESQLEKPIRILKLSKTRHQISRQGAHVFHLLGSVGFRICPQIPSQMDKKEIVRRLLADKNKLIPTLNIIGKAGRMVYKTYLNVFPTSLILIHGQGSSGKAGFALKLLLTPELKIPPNLQEATKEEFENYFKKLLLHKKKETYKVIRYYRKILVISFLYPEEYYKDLINERIYPSIRNVFGGVKGAKKVEVIAYTPGYLTAEDFVNKIVRYLDEAILEGEPYTGVLLDGLHNVLLQFKNLQDNDMVWPLLYSILSRYSLTIVTTFTNFFIAGHHAESERHNRFVNHIADEDQVLLRKGQAPFLHTLVKAADFYFNLDERRDKKNNKRYIISVNNAIYQDNPSGLLEWDRQNLEITGSFNSIEEFSSASF